MFNIVLKLNNHIWKKTTKSAFCGKKWRPNQWFCSRKKAPSLWKKIFWKRKPSSLFVRIWSSKPCAEVFLNKWFLRYLNFSDFKVPKIVLHNKITNKTWYTKNQENSSHVFGDNNLTNRLEKFLQGRIKPWRVRALRVCTGFNFF